MGKYVLLINGKVLKEEKNLNSNSTFEKIDIKDKNFISDNIRISNVNDKIEKISTKISDLSLADSFIFTDIIFGNNSAKKYVLNQTEKLRNNSFGFINGENGENLKDRKIEFNSVFNTIFDIDNNEIDDLNLQTFANNLDFYGIPQLIQNPIDFFTRDISFLLFTLVDSIIASAIPIVTISTLQYLLQTQNEENIFSKSTNSDKNYEFGKYITYFLENTDTTGNYVIELFVKTLNSFERLMNFPSFPEMDTGILGFLKEITKRLTYFITGYVFYLMPGLKYNSDLNVDANISTKLANLIQEILTIDTSKNIFDLLIRKIIRNNIFFKKIQEKARKSENLQNDYSDTISLLGSFFYRFIGQRISIGEKIIKINNISSDSSKQRFSTTRSPNNKLLHNFTSIIPEEANKYEIYSKYSELTNDYKNQLETKNIIRLSKKQVEEIEKIIDLDYVPFSFQDLRNNDIMRFHAFIESISDSYSAAYNEMGGYGRLEKIKSYVNTTRTINISFKLIATSPDDFDQMWYSINKIVTMIYPQWSKPVPARKVNIEEVGILYHIPFTQIPSNTPVIRLRVGDLFTSNHTKVTSSKLFGFEKNEKKNNITSLNTFMIPESKDNSGNILINNSITKTYETTFGKGLAGHITSLGIDWEQNTPWDIDKDRRAPIMVKITIGFSPIHDIPLGLDHNGTMRAVPYMVGKEIYNKYYSDEYYNYEEKEFDSIIREINPRQQNNE